MTPRPMFVRLALLVRRVFTCGVDVTLSSVALLSIKSTLTYIRDHDNAPWSDMLILIAYILMTYFITRSMFYDIVYKRYSAYYAFFMAPEPEMFLGDTVFGSPISQFTHCVYDPIQHAPSIGAGPLAGERNAAEDSQHSSSAEMEMQIFVKDRSRQNLSLRVLVSDTVWLAKVMIREAEGIPPESQRLIFNSKQLDDSRSLLGVMGLWQAATYS